MRRVLTLICLSSLLSLSSFAASKPTTKSISFDQSVQVGDKTLNPGTYKLQWDDSADNTSVTILKGKDVVATVPAKIERKNNNANAAFEVNTANGGHHLDHVYFSHESLDFGGAVSPGM